MIFLDVLSGDSSAWEAQLDAHRMIFKELQERHVIDPKNLPEQDNLAVFNPLSTATDSPWAQYFRNKELEKCIMQDIWRTHPGSEFFQTEWVRKAMLNCLFLFAKENGSTSYRQGMHELLAVVMHLCHQEKMSLEELKQSPLARNKLACSVLDREHLEADAFTIFKHMMHSMNSLFEVVDIRQRVQSDGGYIADKKQAEEHAIGQAPIVHRCRRIQYTLLKKFDQPLFNYLKTLGIEPQLYALRWVRLLFGRDFSFDDVITLWDAIFAWGQGLGLIDYVAVTMLMYMRESLLGREYTDTMGRLMKFPPVDDVAIFVESAIRMASGKASGGQGMPLHAKNQPVEQSRPIVFNSSTGSSGSRSPVSFVGHSDSRLSPVTFTNQTISTSAPNQNVIESKYSLVMESNAILARRLHSLIDTVQHQVLSDETILPDLDVMFLALAELKQMKDILSGALDASDAHLLFGEKDNPAPTTIEEEKEEEKAEENGEEEQEEQESRDVMQVIKPEPKKPAAVQWGDEDEELGSKQSSGDSSWLFGVAK